MGYKAGLSAPSLSSCQRHTFPSCTIQILQQQGGDVSQPTATGDRVEGSAKGHHHVSQLLISMVRSEEGRQLGGQRLPGRERQDGSVLPGLSGKPGYHSVHFHCVAFQTAHCLSHTLVHVRRDTQLKKCQNDEAIPEVRLSAVKLQV